MLNLLIKLFIHDSENCNEPRVRTAYGTLCGIYGIFLNLLLFAGKYAAGLISGSVAIIADAFNNLSDAGSSVITLLGFALAGKKPDPEHPFGHGRIEYITGLAISAIIILVGVDLGKSSIEKIIDPTPVEPGLLPAIILIAAIAVKIYISLYNRRIGRKINSSVMQATALDALTDTISTLVVLLSMAVAYFFKVNIDGWAGLFVALFIIYAGYSAAKDTIAPLLGSAPDPDFVRSVEDTVMAHKEILGIHDLFVHDYGPGRTFISLHAEVDGHGDFFGLHDVVDSAESELKEKFGCLATIHMDPIDSANPEINTLRDKVLEALKRDISEEIKIHDFRVVPGPSHTNLIFDAAVPVDFKIGDSKLEAMIKETVSSSFTHCFAVVNIDRTAV
ncbi:MAG: cation diffusion facilitator family transporter [Oscillospiraceae bacterium]|nr:cation diffusion facilitator family transporter [Oscillospiraceae bacterium]